MKHVSLFVLTATMSLLAAASLAQGAGRSHARLHVTMISFDGYCDGMALNIDGTEVTGERTGCSDEALEGKEHSPRSPALDASIRPVSSQQSTYFIHADQTWEVFVDGRLFNAGTWSYGQPEYRLSGVDQPGPSDAILEVE